MRADIGGVAIYRNKGIAYLRLHLRCKCRRATPSSQIHAYLWFCYQILQGKKKTEQTCYNRAILKTEEFDDARFQNHGCFDACDAVE